MTPDEARLRSEIEAFRREAEAARARIEAQLAELERAKSDFEAVIAAVAAFAERAGLPVKSILSTLGLGPNNRSMSMMNRAQKIHAMVEAAADGAEAVEQIKSLAEQREELVAKLAEIDAAIAAEAEAIAAANEEVTAIVADPEIAALAAA